MRALSASAHAQRGGCRVPAMITTPRVSLTSRIVILACLGCVFALSGVAAAAATVTFQKESVQAYEKQLSSGQITEATINKRVRSVHLTLKDGSHVLVKYAAHEEGKFAAALEAKGVPVTVLKPAAAAKEVAKPVHHKLRYIAGGVLVVVIVVVGGVLLLDRRRKLAAE
jgi:hypothetical protein